MGVKSSKLLRVKAKKRGTNVDDSSCCSSRSMTRGTPHSADAKIEESTSSADATDSPGVVVVKAASDVAKAQPSPSCLAKTRSDTLNYIHVHEKAMEKIFKSNGTAGLKNLGNTCFMNACVQCLAHSVGLTDYFVGYSWKGEINKGNPLGYSGALASEFGDLVGSLWSGRETVVAPEKFKKAMGRCNAMFAGYEQHDAQELLIFLLDGMHEDLNRCVRSKPAVLDKDCDEEEQQEEVAREAWAGYLQRDRSIIVDLFQGQLRSTLKCDSCKFTRRKFDPFMFLSVPVKGKTLEGCIEQFSSEEHLDGDEKWYCPKCKTHQTATKQIELWKLPPVLIVHLKRFDSQSRKIATRVEFPLQDLDLSKFVKSKRQRDLPKYDCYAVANHHDIKFGGGHYTAYAKNRIDDAWYLFDDDHSHVVEPSAVAGDDAYVLFFSRVVISQEAAEQGVSSTGIRRQSVSLPHLWPHYSATPDADLANLPLNTTPPRLNSDAATSPAADQKKAKPPSIPRKRGQPPPIPAHARIPRIVKTPVIR